MRTHILRSTHTAHALRTHMYCTCRNDRAHRESTPTYMSRWKNRFAVQRAYMCICSVFKALYGRSSVTINNDHGRTRVFLRRNLGNYNENRATTSPSRTRERIPGSKNFSGISRRKEMKGDLGLANTRFSIRTTGRRLISTGDDGNVA